MTPSPLTSLPTFELADGQRLTVLRHTEALLEVRADWEPGGAAPLAHLHPAQDERFEVLEGELTVDLGDERVVLRTGDTLEIPRGTPHAMFNGGDLPARATWLTLPAGRTIELWAGIEDARRTGPEAFGPLLTEYADVFRIVLPASG